MPAQSKRSRTISSNGIRREEGGGGGVGGGGGLGWVGVSLRLLGGIFFFLLPTPPPHLSPPREKEAQPQKSILGAQQSSPQAHGETAASLS